MSNEPAPAEPLIVVEHVAKSFDVERGPVLGDVTFSVAAGEFVALAGPSGSGKSTTLHLLAALDRVDHGTISVLGTDITRGHRLDHHRREGVGIVFQLHNLLPHLDARQNIEIVMMGTRRHQRERHERADALLAALDLTEHAQSVPPELSGGERQRVAVARAFANEPRVILADEPTGSLDDERAADVVALLRTHCRDGGAVLAVSHDPRLTNAVDRILHLEDGVITEETPRAPVVEAAS